MMALLLTLSIVGLVVATFAATAVVAVNEVAWHDLEEYCKQIKRPQLFGEIFDLRESISLGANILHMIATAFGVVGLVGCVLYSRSVIELDWSRFVWLIVLVAFSLVVTGSWIPWAIAQIGSTVFLVRTWRWWWLVSLLAMPLLLVGDLVSRLFKRASGHEESDEDEEEAFEDEILSMVSEGEHDGYLESDARDMIEGVMELDDQDVAMIMTPRSKIDAMELATSWEDAVRRVVESGRTRIPVYDKQLDRISGILYAKDLLRESLRSESKRRPLRKLLRNPLVVPETKALDEMLKMFLRGRNHMAVVQDEYGGVAGVVTIEDVLEEIVGEIEDETDNERDTEIRVLKHGEVEVAGGVHLSRLNEEFGLQLPVDEDFDTLAGLIMHQLNEIPRSGRKLTFGRLEMRVVLANRRNIETVRIQISDEPRNT